MSDEHPNNDTAHLQTAVDHCLERFGSVQIFASRIDDDGNTIDCNLGGGNWGARKEAAPYVAAV